MSVIGLLRQRRNMAILIIAACIVGGLLIWLAVDRMGDKEMSPEDSKAISSRIVREVGHIYILPQNETPTVAQIEDVSRLANQEFYRNAKTGDYVLVYDRAKLALIYRESMGKLVNVGPIHLKNTGGSQGP